MVGRLESGVFGLPIDGELLSVGTTITVWAESVEDGEGSTAVTKYDGSGDVEDLVLNAGVLTVGSTIDDVSVVASDFGLYDNDDDEDIMHSYNSRVLSVDADKVYVSDTLDILSGSVLTIGSTDRLEAHDVKNEGKLTLSGTAEMFVGGSWDNAGEFNSNESEVRFLGSSGGGGSETIKSDGKAFNDVGVGRFNMKEGLKYHWKFDETAANTCTGGSNDACDSSGNGQDGYWNGNTNPNTDVPNSYYGNTRSLYFDESNDSVNVGTLTYDFTQGFTVCVWAKRVSTTNYGRIFHFGPNNGSNTDAILIESGYYTNSMQFRVVNNTTWTVGITKTNVDITSWHHYCGMYDGDSKAKFYFDGGVSRGRYECEFEECITRV